MKAAVSLYCCLIVIVYIECKKSASLHNVEEVHYSVWELVTNGVVCAQCGPHDTCYYDDYHYHHHRYHHHHPCCHYYSKIGEQCDFVCQSMKPVNGVVRDHNLVIMLYGICKEADQMVCISVTVSN